MKKLYSDKPLGMIFNPLNIMVLPGVIYLLINNYIPLAGIIVAFKNFKYNKGIFGSEWIGFENFKYLFRTKDALLITRNTLLYNVVFILLILFFSVLLAILLNEVRSAKLRKAYQSFILFPYLISMVIVGYFVFSLLSFSNGLFNKSVLPLFGMEPINWYTEPKAWPVILTIINTWNKTGYFAVIYYAAIIGINEQIFEASLIDGANKIQQIVYITLPSIKKVVVVMVLLQIGRIFYADFGLFYQVPLNTGALMSTTNVIDTFVYRSLINLGDIGMASAAGVYQALVGFVLIFIANLIVRKIDADSALF